MDFSVRLLNENDYDDILTKWWGDWGGVVPSRDALPNNGTGGFMISKGDVDICAGYAYFTNSSIAFCEFIVSNINYREKDRNKAIEFLIETTCLACKEAGYRFMWASVQNKNLVNKYKNAGYKETEKNCIELVKHL
jgi:hypothetical protein